VIEPVRPLPQVAREMLATDPVMAADQPSFDVLNSGWMIGKNSPGFALSPGSPVCSKCSPRSGITGHDSRQTHGQQCELAATLASTKAPSSAPVPAGDMACVHRKRRTRASA
jgi:hypothetical protein